MENIFNKMRDILLGGREEEAEYEEYDEIEEETVEYSREPELSRPARRSTESNNMKVVSLHPSMQMGIVISYPESVDDASCICDFLKNSQTVVVNLEKVGREQSQRIVDFLSGVSYAISGEIQSVSSRIFIVAPANVNITGKFKEELKANELIFPWVTSL